MPAALAAALTDDRLARLLPGQGLAQTLISLLNNAADVPVLPLGGHGLTCGPPHHRALQHKLAKRLARR